MSEPRDPLEELESIIDEDKRLLADLVASFNRLLGLVDETSRRHHELYMSWTRVLMDEEGTPPSGSFIPRIVKK